MRARSALIISLAIGMALSIACTSSFGPMRATTFPKDLTYLSSKQLRTSMWVLAAEVQALEQILERMESGEVDPASKEAEVRKALARMKIAAHALEKPGRSTQHPVLNANLDTFIRRLDRAERALEHEPPNYFPASTVVGSCYLCHGTTKAMAVPTETGRDARAAG
jgi:hypothetical protein